MWRVAVLALALVACKKEKVTFSDERGEGAREAVAPMPAGAVRTSGKHFTVDTAPAAACASGAACTVLAELTALDGYKVNEKYPFRFVLEPADGVTLVGEPSFRVHRKSQGRLTIEVKRAGAPTRVAGQFKLSVCNPDECLVETAALAVNIP